MGSPNRGKYAACIVISENHFLSAVHMSAFQTLVKHLPNSLIPLILFCPTLTIYCCRLFEVELLCWFNC